MKNVNIDHYIGVYDNVFDENFCQHVIDRFEDIEESSGYAHQDGTHQFENGSLGRRDNSIFFCQLRKDIAHDIQQKVMECFNEYKKLTLDQKARLLHLTLARFKEQVMQAAIIFGIANTQVCLTA